MVEKIWREWAALHRLDFQKVLAASHRRRTIDTVQAFAPSGIDIEAEAKRLEAQSLAEKDGVFSVGGAKEFLTRLRDHRWAVGDIREPRASDA